MSEEFNEVQAIKAVFSTREGEKLLEYWDDIFNQRLSYHPQNTPEQTAHLEGHRAFYLAITQAMRADK